MGDKKIYILLSQTNSIISRLIRIFTKEPYNHVSIGFDKSLEKELFSFGRYYTYFPFWAGFINENIKSGLFKAKKSTNACIYEVIVSEDKYNRLKELIAEIKDKKHKYRFNMIGMALVAFNISLRRKYKKYCAEFVSEVLHGAGIHKQCKAHCLARPHDFHDVSGSTMIFEGKLVDYKA